MDHTMKCKNWYDGTFAMKFSVSVFHTSVERNIA